MDFQLLRSLGAANYMGGTVGEIFAAIRNTNDGDPRSWPPIFASLGDQTQTIARSVLPKHRVSARDHFQRASMYDRVAEYHDDPGHRGLASARPSITRRFLEAAKLMPGKVEVLQIRFESVWLPGYFSAARRCRRRTDF